MVQARIAPVCGDTPLPIVDKTTKGSYDYQNLRLPLFCCEHLALPCEQSSFDYRVGSGGWI